MKRFLCCLMLSTAAFGAKASHLMGGDLILKNIVGNQYEVRLTEYRDTLGIPLYQSETIQMYSFDASTNSYTFDSSWSISLNPSLSTALLANFPYGVEVGIYTDTISLPAGQYRFVMSSCCRNANILNMSAPASESMLLYTDLTVYPGGNNSSPDFLAMPVAYFQINDTVNYNPLPYDPDGDSLVWSLNIPYTGGTAGTTFDTVQGFTAPAADPAGPFTMNPVTGEITWIPNQLGNWVQSFVVDEYRNGVKIGSVIRDFQYVIVPQDTTNMNAPYFIVNNPSVNYNAAQNYNWMYYYSTEPLTFEIKGADADANATLEMQGFSEIFQLPVAPATFSTNTQSGIITGTLNWTPSATYDRDVILVFRLRDGAWTRDYTLLLTKSPFPSNITTTSSLNAQAVVFPNPVSNKLNVSIDLNDGINGDVALYNALGQKVATVFQGALTKGAHVLTADVQVAAGAYNLVIRNGNQIVKSVNVAVK